MKVTIDPRKKRREIQNALGDNILRYITELLTNSDDSYKRLETDFPEKINDNVIYIYHWNQTEETMDIFYR